MTRYSGPWGVDVSAPTRPAPVPALPHVDDIDLLVSRDDPERWATWESWCPCGSDLRVTAEIRRAEETDEVGPNGALQAEVVESVACPVCYADHLSKVLRDPQRCYFSPVEVLVEPRWWDQSGAGRLRVAS